MVFYALFELSSAHFNAYTLIGVYKSNPLDIIYEQNDDYHDHEYNNPKYNEFNEAVIKYDPYNESDNESDNEKLIIAELKIFDDKYKIQKLNIDHNELTDNILYIGYERKEHESEWLCRGF